MSRQEIRNEVSTFYFSKVAEINNPNIIKIIRMIKNTLEHELPKLLNKINVEL